MCRAKHKVVADNNNKSCTQIKEYKAWTFPDKAGKKKQKTAERITNQIQNQIQIQMHNQIQNNQTNSTG